MSAPIPTPGAGAGAGAGPRTKSPSAASSPSPFYTPASTPPAASSFTEARLQQLLAGFEHAQREMAPGPGGAAKKWGENDGRRGSYSAGEHLPTPPDSRRPSFLAGFRPAFTPLTPAHPAPASQPASPRLPPTDRPKSALSSHPHLAALSLSKLEDKDAGAAVPPPAPPGGTTMLRSKSVTLPGQKAGFLSGLSRAAPQPPPPKLETAAKSEPAVPQLAAVRAEEQRHFDPSKEPRLLML